MTISSASAVSARMLKVAEATKKAQVLCAEQASAALLAGVRSTSPSRLRGVGKSGAKLSVTVKTNKSGIPSSTGRAVGPWPIIEYDTPTHLIGIGRATSGTRAGARHSRKRAKIFVSNGAAIGGFLHGAGYPNPVRGPIVHPGTHGKLVFHKGVALGTPRAVKKMRDTTVTAVKEAFT